MNLDYFVLGILLSLLIGQQAFWWAVTLKLVNRLMSRNYAEVVQVEQMKKQAPAAPVQDMQIDPEDERQAQALNSLMGIVS